LRKKVFGFLKRANLLKIEEFLKLTKEIPLEVERKKIEVLLEGA